MILGLPAATFLVYLGVSVLIIAFLVFWGVTYRAKDE